MYYKGKITIKYPNDLLINKKKISGILQETITVSNKKFIIVGIGLNLVKNPYIENYPMTNLSQITNIIIKKNDIILKLKSIYEKFIPKFIKFNVININKI